MEQDQRRGRRDERRVVGALAVSPAHAEQAPPPVRVQPRPCRRLRASAARDPSAGAEDRRRGVSRACRPPAPPRLFVRRAGAGRGQ